MRAAHALSSIALSLTGLTVAGRLAAEDILPAPLPDPLAPPVQTVEPAVPAARDDMGPEAESAAPEAAGRPAPVRVTNAAEMDVAEVTAALRAYIDSIEGLVSQDDAMVLDGEAASRRALGNARRVLAAYADLAAAQASADLQRSRLYPQVSLSAGYTRQKEIDGSTISLGASSVTLGARADEVWAYGARVDQFVFGFGVWGATLRAADATAMAAGADVDLARLVAVRVAREAVARVRFARADVAIGRDRLDLRLSELEDASNLFEAGRVARIDVRQAQIDAVTAANQLRASEATYRTTIKDLIAVLALEDAMGDASAIRVAGDLDALTDMPERVAGAEAQVGDAAALRRIRHGMDLASADLDAARAEQLPQVGVFAGYDEAGEDLDDTDDDWRVGVSVTWNVFAGGQASARREVARSQLASLRQGYAAEREQRTTRLAQARVESESLTLQVAAQQQTVLLAEANYNDVRELYRAGRITLTRVSEASLAVSEARFILANQLFSQHLVAIELDDLAERLPVDEAAE